MTNTKEDPVSGNSDGVGGYIIGAQYLALEAINNDSTILKDYELVLSIHNAKNHPARAINQAIQIARPPSLEVANRENTFTIPIMLGAPSSPLSILTNPILSAFHWAQISSAATSVQLAEDGYPTFYRTVPADNIQANTIIWICTEFNWTSIAILYQGDSYGVYLSNAIQELAVHSGIKTHSVSYVGNEDSIHNAANAILETGTFIIILIPEISELTLIFHIFDIYGLLQFPYYYIGVDSWFQTQRILNTKTNNYTKGFIGTVPWQPKALNYQAYFENGYGEMYNASINLWNQLIDTWEWSMIHNEEFNTILQFLHAESRILDIYAIYGWDSAVSMALALDEYDKRYNLSNILNETIKTVSLRLQSILQNESFWFLGITGNVSFDQNGNRRNGLYALGNIIDDEGTIEYFGVWADGINTTEDEDHEECEECAENIIWPDKFIEYGLIPRSYKLITNEIEGLSQTAKTIMFVLCIISMLIVVLTIILQWKWRDNAILKAASWKLNCLTCTGCLLTHLTIIVYSIEPSRIWCNFREWLLVISFTLVFMPLFLKTYRIAVIFTSMMKTKIRDFKLVIGVMICLLIDSMMLIFFTSIEIERVVFLDGPRYEQHELHEIQILYRYCLKNIDSNTMNLVMMFVISGWKCIQLLFGLSVALIVSTIELESARQFNETSAQIIAILFTIVVFCAASIPVLFHQVNNPTSYYCILGICGLLITNVVLIANVLPRLCAVARGKEENFKMKQQDIFKATMRNSFKKRTKRSMMNVIYEAELLAAHQRKRVKHIKSGDLGTM